MTEPDRRPNRPPQSRALPVMSPPPPQKNNPHPRRFWEGHEFTRADRASSLIVPSGREPARKALFSIRRSCKADSSELKFLGMTKRKSGRNSTTKSRAPPVMFLPHRPPTTHIRADFGKGTSLLVPIELLLSTSRAGGSLRGKPCSRSGEAAKQIPRN